MNWRKLKMFGTGWSSNLMTALKVIGMLAAGIVGIIFLLIIGVIVVGFLDLVAATLTLPAAATAAINNVTAAYYSFIDSLLVGVSLVGDLVPIVIILIVFAAVGFAAYAISKKGKGGSGSNY